MKSLETSKEKAEKLVNLFSKAQDEQGYINTNKYRHIECALIHVDEIILMLENMHPFGNTKYWLDVKMELNKII